MKSLSEILEQAKDSDSDSILSLVDKVERILVSERERTSEKIKIIGRLVRLPASGRATVIGDIHGDMQSLGKILADSNFLERADKPDEYIIFLGDYGDRGLQSPEVYYVVLNLKSMFPNNVILLQGNHEGPEDLLAHPHDLPIHIKMKMGAGWESVYSRLSELFRKFYTCVLVEEKCVMLHGGVPSKARTIDDVAYAFEKHPMESHLEEILWSDPSDEIRGAIPSSRGAGYIFGEDVTESFIRMLRIRFVIRGHEPAEMGYKYNHSGRILTLFSRKGPPYSNSQGAYLTFDLSGTYESALSLEPYIRKF
ncbi:MAG: metallophosphoesterase family protein [Nitrososphaerota archaeon]|nr:serine/threonine protein phosphatase [Candidatus Bathyarchaeota archaeon]MDW8048757.1 metallophosphoesterase family protein [Nitrososphaerota archaeon]